MKNSILILGPQCSGKTTKANQLLSLKEYSDFIVFDAVESVKRIKNISRNLIDKSVIITTCLKKDDIPETLLKNFEIIELNRLSL
jgi:adenylate kinase family enzyme